MRELIDTPGDAWPAIVASRPDLKLADSWLACTIFDCLKPDGIFVKDFLHKRLRNAEMAASGRACLAYLGRRDAIVSSYDMEAARQRFKSAPGYTEGMSKYEVANVSAELQEMWSDLRLDNPNDKLGVHMMLLGKMPALLRSKAEAIEEAIYDKQVLEGTVITVDAVIEMIATRLRVTAASRAAAASSASTSSGERDPPRRGRGRDRERSFIDDAICYNCGKKGHVSVKCPSGCLECKLPFCPGNQGKPCLLATSRPIPAIVKNATGVPVGARIREVLVKRHAAKFPSASAIDAGADSVDDVLFDDGVGAIVSSGEWAGAGFASLALSRDAADVVSSSVGAAARRSVRFGGSGAARGRGGGRTGQGCGGGRGPPPPPVPARALAPPIFPRPSQA